MLVSAAERRSGYTMQYNKMLPGILERVLLLPDAERTPNSRNSRMRKPHLVALAWTSSALGGRLWTSFCHATCDLCLLRLPVAILATVVEALPQLKCF
jgi:hypothetical protein